jgi:hypothetical protein
MAFSSQDFFSQVGGPFAAMLGRQQQADPFTVALQASVQAQKDANAIAAAASVPQQDSESARAASDDQRRRLTQGSNFGIGLQTQLGAPPVGFRMLSGQ